MLSVTKRRTYHKWRKVMLNYHKSIYVGCCNRFSSTLIKWYSKLTKITIFYSLYHIPPFSTGWTNWPINEVHISNFSSVNIKTYSIPFYHTRAAINKLVSLQHCVSKDVSLFMGFDRFFVHSLKNQQKLDRRRSPSWGDGGGELLMSDYCSIFVV